MLDGPFVIRAWSLIRHSSFVIPAGRPSRICLPAAGVQNVRDASTAGACASASCLDHWVWRSGKYTPIEGSPFANAGKRNFIPPGNNSDGDGDWVLVLEVDAP